VSTPGNSVPLPVPAGSFGSYVPITFGQALDRVFKLLKAHMRVFLAIASIPSAINACLFAVLIAGFLVVLQPWNHPDPTMHLAGVASLAVLMIIAEFGFLAVYAVYQPAASYVALHAEAGLEVKSRDAFAHAWSKFGRYLWLLILRTIIVAGPIMLFAAFLGGGIALASIRSNGHVDPNAMFAIFPLFFLIYAFASVYMAFALIWTAFSYPACIDEDLTAAAAISRSVRLTKGARVRIFLLAAVIYAISYAAFLIIECILGVVGGIVVLAGSAMNVAVNPWGYIAGGLALVCLLILMSSWMAISTSAYSTAFAVLYRNQRVLKERVALGGAVAPSQ
jgi:hypothetical protein